MQGMFKASRNVHNLTERAMGERARAESRGALLLLLQGSATRGGDTFMRAVSRVNPDTMEESSKDNSVALDWSGTSIVHPDMAAAAYGL